MNNGLGKTLQIISLARYKKLHQGLKHCLIICGVNSLKWNWVKEVEKFCKEEKARVLGTKVNTKGRTVPITVEEMKQQIKECPEEFFWIINIERIRLSKEEKKNKTGVVHLFNELIEKGELGMIAIDECHKCFDYNTMITTDIGNKKIGDIVSNKIQCNVCSFNEQSKQLEWKPIVNWYKNNTSLTPCVKISINNTDLVCTYNHKFYTVNRGWVNANQLTPEDEIIYYIKDTDNYIVSKIIGIENIDSEDIMYDIEVADNNNYFANGILVHNCKNPNSSQGQAIMEFDKTASKIGMTRNNISK